MSAGDTLEDKRKRRRELRRQAAEAVPVESVESEDELAEDDDDDEDGSGRGLSERKGRATPSRRTQEVEEAKTEGNFITRTVTGLRDYIEGVRSEVQKVVWPTREEIRRLTIIVLVVTVLASITLGVISLLFNLFINTGLNSGNSTLFLVALVITIAVFAFYLRRSNRRTSSF